MGVSELPDIRRRLSAADDPQANPSGRLHHDKVSFKMLLFRRTPLDRSKTECPSRIRKGCISKVQVGSIRGQTTLFTSPTRTRRTAPIMAEALSLAMDATAAPISSGRR